MQFFFQFCVNINCVSLIRCFVRLNLGTEVACKAMNDRDNDRGKGKDAGAHAGRSVDG